MHVLVGSESTIDDFKSLGKRHFKYLMIDFILCSLNFE